MGRPRRRPHHSAAIGSGCIDPDSASLGDVSGSVVAHHPPALDPLAVEPGDSTAEKADHCWLLLVCQDLDIGQPCHVVDGDMDLVVADPVGTTPLAIAGDAVAHLPEPGQRFDVNVDQVARPVPLVPLHWWFGLQIPQTAQSQTAERPGVGGEGGLQQPGDVAETQTLVAEVDGFLQLLLIERPPLGAARAASIRQRGHAA